MREKGELPELDVKSTDLDNYTFDWVEVCPAIVLVSQRSQESLRERRNEFCHARSRSSHPRRIPPHRGGEALQSAKWSLAQVGPLAQPTPMGTVREDYSPDSNAWDYLSHDHSRSRAYRWGEDGIAGFSDHYQRLCLSLALWNGRDPILKERLFGLTNAEGITKIARSSITTWTPPPPTLT
jgi:hypothetical protein